MYLRKKPFFFCHPSFEQSYNLPSRSLNTISFSATNTPLETSFASLLIEIGAFAAASSSCIHMGKSQHLVNAHALKTSSSISPLSHCKQNAIKPAFKCTFEKSIAFISLNASPYETVSSARQNCCALSSK